MKIVTSNVVKLEELGENRYVSVYDTQTMTNTLKKVIVRDGEPDRVIVSIPDAVDMRTPYQFDGDAAAEFWGLFVDGLLVEHAKGIAVVMGYEKLLDDLQLPKPWIDREFENEVAEVKPSGYEFECLSQDCQGWTSLSNTQAGGSEAACSKCGRVYTLAHY